MLLIIILIETMISYLTKNSKTLLLILTVLVGLILFYPQIDYQEYISQGDHGRDLYAFSQAYEGEIPYQDYWWVYGPIMPYYYGMFFKVLGTSMPSILFGKIILALVSGAFIFLSISLFAEPLLAFAGALWFFANYPDFFFTYNHAGGITAIVYIVYCLIRYINRQKISYLYNALPVIFILCLIKINFGLFNLAGFTIIVALTNKTCQSKNTSNKKYYLISLLALPLCVFSIYYLLLHKLPMYEIRQCLPYLSKDHPHNLSIIKAISLFLQIIKFEATSKTVNIFFSTVLALSLINIIWSTKLSKLNNIFKDKNIITFTTLLFLLILNLHEFLVSGVNYRLLWSKPFSILLIFFIIASSSKNYSRFIKNLLALSIIFAALSLSFSKNTLIKNNKIGFNYLPLNRAKIFTINPPLWKQTVNQSVNYLNTRLKTDETFFALPYDPLYHYLTNKKTPTRQTIFFEHINIPKEQEMKIIKELEDKNVHWILLSNRLNSSEKGLGLFGKDYCPNIANYIDNNFILAEQFGDWANEPGWAWTHGTKILKRK